MSIHIDAPAFPQFQPDDVPGQGWFGLTKREYFAAMASGPDDDASAEYVAACLGISCPERSTSTREWMLWWRTAQARWKVEEADALIAALDAAPTEPQ